jgi:hypothetical protein
MKFRELFPSKEILTSDLFQVGVTVGFFLGMIVGVAVMSIYI